MTKKNGKAIWASKIVGHDRVDPNSLVANPYNHRKHPQKQRDALAAAIREVGFIRSVTVNKRTGNVIDGHERLTQAIESGQPEIDVEYVDLSEEDERKVLASMDRIAELAEVDPDKLDNAYHDEREGRPPSSVAAAGSGGGQSGRGCAVRTPPLPSDI